MIPAIDVHIMCSVKRSLIVFFLILPGITQTGCKKLVTVGSPNTEITSDNIYTNDATAASVLTGIYALLNTNSPLSGTSLNSLSLVAGLSADEFTLYGGSANANTSLVQYYENRLLSGSSAISTQSIWSDCYSKLYTVNIALERLALSNGLTPAVKKQLTGEAEFLRAFFYFYLVNLYGNVPLLTSSNYTFNSVAPRSPAAQVYRQIISDLKDAQNLLVDGYVASDALTPTAEKLRPNKWVATALLARTYLYTGAYDSAALQASAVINNANYTLSSRNGVFLKNSSEALWQWQPVNTGWNTEDARIFLLPPGGPTNSFVTPYPVYLSPQLLGSFEAGDGRRRDWVDSVIVNGIVYYYPYKYKSATLNAPVTEYLMIFRLAEQYLIRAEARVRVNSDFAGARADLDTIRSRAGLSPVTANDSSSLLATVRHERQVELFTEWGNRWLDLKRTGTVDGVMDTVAVSKGSTWSAYWQWYPVPLYDITQNPQLVQNAGY